MSTCVYGTRVRISIKTDTMNRQEELVSIAKQATLNDAVDSQGDTVLGAMVDSGEWSEVEYLEVCSIMLDMKSHNTRMK